MGHADKIGKFNPTGEINISTKDTIITDEQIAELQNTYSVTITKGRGGYIVKATPNSLLSPKDLNALIAKMNQDFAGKDLIAEKNHQREIRLL